MPLHANSILAYRDLSLGERNAVVLSVYANSPIPLTDREAAAQIEGMEFGNVKPRVSNLIDDGFLYQVDSVKCATSGKKVRRCSFTGLVNPA